MYVCTVYVSILSRSRRGLEAVAKLAGFPTPAAAIYWCCCAATHSQSVLFHSCLFPGGRTNRHSGSLLNRRRMRPLLPEAVRAQPEELRVHSVPYKSIKSTTYLLIYCGTMQYSYNKFFLLHFYSSFRTLCSVGPTKRSRWKAFSFESTYTI